MSGRTKTPRKGRHHPQLHDFKAAPTRRLIGVRLGRDIYSRRDLACQRVRVEGVPSRLAVERGSRYPGKPGSLNMEWTVKGLKAKKTGVAPSDLVPLH